MLKSCLGLLHSKGDMWHTLLKKKKEKRKPFKLKATFSLLTQKIQKLFSLSLSLLFSLLPPPLKLHQSSNLCSPFLLQIAKGSHFRSREVHLYVVGLQISGLGRLLSHMIFVGIGFWEIWWVVLLGLCIVMVICEEICWKHVELAMFGWVKLTHSVLGFLWWCLWCLCVEIAMFGMSQAYPFCFRVFMMMLVMLVCWNGWWKTDRDVG